MSVPPEHGETMKQIGVWTGHESHKEIEGCVRKAGTKQLLTSSVLETDPVF